MGTVIKMVKGKSTWNYDVPDVQEDISFKVPEGWTVDEIIMTAEES